MRLRLELRRRRIIAADYGRASQVTRRLLNRALVRIRPIWAKFGLRRLDIGQTWPTCGRRPVPGATWEQLWGSFEARLVGRGHFPGRAGSNCPAAFGYLDPLLESCGSRLGGVRQDGPLLAGEVAPDSREFCRRASMLAAEVVRARGVGSR